MRKNFDKSSPRASGDIDKGAINDFMKRLFYSVVPLLNE